MQPRGHPLYYNDLTLSLAHAWDLLELGACDRHTGFHALTIATVEGDQPRQRTMILREANRNTRILRFHSDVRSPKFTQIKVNPAIAVSHYDAKSKCEIRMIGRGEFHTDNALATTAWNEMRDVSRFCYRSPRAPGDVVSSPDEYLSPDSHSVTRDDAIARKNFCVLLITVAELEWIYLDSSGNRRARYTWHDNILDQQWIQH
jgi:pyridoxamine 5'-phosphate oxidase